MEAFLSTLDLEGKGGEILRAAANFEGIYWNVSALNSALASCLITTTTGEVGTPVRRVLQALPGASFRAWQVLNRWYRPTSAVEGAASMAGIIPPSGAKSNGELHRFIMDWELCVAEHEARHNEYVQDSVKVAALKKVMSAEMAERYIEGPNTHPELRSRVAARVGEKMTQQSHAPMDVGEFKGEVEGSDDQVDELIGTRRPRRDERSTHQRRKGKQPWKAPPSERQEKREEEEEEDDTGIATTAEARATQRDSAQHLQTTPPKLSTRSRRRMVMCGGSRGNAHSMVRAMKTMTSWDGMGVHRKKKSKWKCLASVVDLGAAENVLPADVCSHVKPSATRRSEAGIGFRGGGGERIRNHGQRKVKVRMTDGHVAGSTWQVADVKRPLMSMAKMVAARNLVCISTARIPG